uniref:hypothetical protein n=1 Tax=Erythrolobus coxiae TaxID=362235 RepID=UPI001FCD6C19|nr:hypothetical protein MW556_pgp170 [Erythrolobus coxiae]UNJ17637.1 hypothetical protein [Erythrolobus coxiae]
MRIKEAPSSIFVRLFCFVPYILPILEGFQDFGELVLPDYPFGIMRMYKKTFMPYVAFYMEHGWVSMVIFMLLYYFIVSQKAPISFHRIIKFNTLHAIILYMITIVFANLFRLLPIGFKASLYGMMLCNTLFWFVLSTVLYSLWHAINATYPEIPVLSEGARMHLDFEVD